MKEMVEELKTLRGNLENAKQDYSARLGMFHESTEEMTQGIDVMKLKISYLTCDISAAALKEYEETKNNKPYPGIGIRLMKKMEYNEKDAMQWAQEHNLALKLDVRDFEKHAVVSKLDFVKVVEVPKVTISANL